MTRDHYIVIDEAHRFAETGQLDPLPGPRYTPPAPPPADMPIDPDKWRALDRTTRRALVREHRRVTRS